MKIAIIYSLPTRRAMATPYKATDEDTKDSGEQVASALTTKGARVELVPVGEDSIDRITRISADVIFNLIEWDGFDMPLSTAAFAAITKTGIPYTGPPLEAVTICNDKRTMKRLLDTGGLPTPRWQLFRTGTEALAPSVHPPVILKLAWEHCSVGLTKDAVITIADGLHAAAVERIRIFGQPVIVEEFIGGREFQVTLLKEKKGLVVLPPAEIVFATRGTQAFLTYASRWNEAHAEYHESWVIKATIPASLLRRISWVSRKTFGIFGFRDYARLDIRVRGDEIFILEANANPGLSDDDAYGMTVSYKAAGMTFADFCWEIVQSCLRRWQQEKVSP